MRRRGLVTYIALAMAAEQLSKAVEKAEKERPQKLADLFANRSDFWCPNCGDVSFEQAKQAERDETCLYVCRQCGSVVDEPIPF